MGGCGVQCTHHDGGVIVEAGTGKVRGKVGQAALVHGAGSPMRATEVYRVPLGCDLLVGVGALGQVPPSEVAATAQAAVVSQHKQDALAIASHIDRVEETMEGGNATVRGSDRGHRSRARARGPRFGPGRLE